MKYTESSLLKRHDDVNPADPHHINIIKEEYCMLIQKIGLSLEVWKQDSHGPKEADPSPQTAACLQNNHSCF